jgi:hypothetical protein
MLKNFSRSGKLYGSERMKFSFSPIPGDSQLNIYYKGRAIYSELDSFCSILNTKHLFTVCATARGP